MNMRPRHKNHDKIVEAVLEGNLRRRTIAKMFKITLGGLNAIIKERVEIRRERKFDPGEGQLNMWDYFRPHRPRKAK